MKVRNLRSKNAKIKSQIKKKKRKKIRDNKRKKPPIKNKS